MEALRKDLQDEIIDLQKRRDAHFCKAMDYQIEIQNISRLIKSCTNQKQYKVYVSARSTALREICRKRSILKVAVLSVEQKIKKCQNLLDLIPVQ